ncbi:hypothetical protein [Kitasatospora sp. NBC_01300]|uniref:hypothetical protein n=1 Tax=Kitasatospora sp. NBC_01300 TaxID=2903574 RepID=UPI002F907B86|nr:hypothetical protein OG556_40890 [Kitasatospora sp. NBC_01300]
MPQPNTLFPALADALALHVTTGARRTRTDLPNGYAVAAGFGPHGPAGDLQAAVFAPSQQGPTRICNARFSPGTALPAATRLLARAVREAPAAPCAPTVRPALADVARHLTVGAPEQRPDEPGLFVEYGHATAWLCEGRLGVTLGSATSGGSITFSGPWDAVAVAAMVDCALLELTDAQALAAEVSALLPARWNRVLHDQWHPAAAVALPRHSPGPDDPLGRKFSRELMAAGRELLTRWPDLEMQPFCSNEGAAVALRVSRREARVPELVKFARLVPPRAGEPPISVLHSEYVPPAVRAARRAALFAGAGRE